MSINRTDAGEKSRSGDAGPPLRRIAVPPRLWVPCDVPPKPIGTQVVAGEALSIGPWTSAVAIAPANGRIVGVRDADCLGDARRSAVELETATRDDAAPSSPTDPERLRTVLAKLAPGELIEGTEPLAAAGVSARRWTCPDLIEQLKQAARRPLAAVVCTALDLDPVLPLQQTLAIAYSWDVIGGVAALARLTGAGQAVLVLPEDMSPPAIAQLQSAARTSNVRLVPLPLEYPLAHPSLLLKRLMNRRLAPGRLPTEAGALVFDAAAALSVGRCLIHHEPMLRVPFGVYDVKQNAAHLLEVPIGTRVADMLEGVNLNPLPHELRGGHALRELPVGVEAIVAGTELTLFAGTAHGPTEPAACLRCGWCVDACPVRIHPAGLLEAAQRDDPELARRYGLPSCIDCGICSYVCPSQLPLLESIRLLRR